MNTFVKAILGVSILVTIAIIALFALPATATTVDTSRDCDKYAVMYCGSMTQKEILKKYNEGDTKNSASNIQAIFDKFSITESKLKNAKFVEGIVYQNGEVKVGKKVVATDAKTYIRTMGKVSTSKMGSAQAALVALDDTGKFTFAVMTPCGNPVTGIPVEPPKPKPEPEKPVPPPQSLSCDALKVTITDAKARKVSATVTGSVQNTTITGYAMNFGDNTVINQQSAEHTYANYGTYTVTATVSGSVNGQQTTVGGTGGCMQQVEFKEPPKPLVQSLTCDALTLVSYNNEKRYVKVTVNGTATNTSITGYKLDFGDGTQPDKSQTSEHTYANYGEYTIVGHVIGMVDGKEALVTSVNCEKVVEFKEAPKMCPTNPALTENDPNCKPCPSNPALTENDPNCKPCPSNPELNFDDPKCEEPVTPQPPTELPNTGTGSVVGLFAGISILGAVGHKMWLGKRIS